MAEDKPDLVNLALTLVGEVGWRRFSLIELARRADLSLAEVHAELPSRQHLLRRLGERLDAAMLDITVPELVELSPRERLFELIMRRLEAMQPYRPALRAMSRDVEPGLLAMSCRNLDRASGWLLDATEADLGGCLAQAARLVLTLLYARVFSVWLNDDSPDQAATLAELDRRLQQVEQLASWVGPRRDAMRAARDLGPAPEAAEI